MEVRGLGNRKYSVEDLIEILKQYPQNATFEIDVDADVMGYDSFSELDSILWDIKSNAVTLLVERKF